jgi:phosphate transport system permease protein
MTATILSIGRIIGESAALIYTMGTFISDKPEILKGATSLAVQIWSIMNGDQPNFGLASAISIIILVMVLIMNLSVKLLTRKRLKRW